MTLAYRYMNKKQQKSQMKKVLNEPQNHAAGESFWSVSREPMQSRNILRALENHATVKRV